MLHGVEVKRVGVLLNPPEIFDVGGGKYSTTALWCRILPCHPLHQLHKETYLLLLVVPIIKHHHGAQVLEITRSYIDLA
jgi:hypothetical protein